MKQEQKKRHYISLDCIREMLIQSSHCGPIEMHSEVKECEEIIIKL
jgi:hypothetical protein